MFCVPATLLLRSSLTGAIKPRRERTVAVQRSAAVAASPSCFLWSEQRRLTRELVEPPVSLITGVVTETRRRSLTSHDNGVFAADWCRSILVLICYLNASMQQVMLAALRR